MRALIAAIADSPVVIGASLGGIASLLAITESPTAPVAGLVLVDVAHRFQPRGGGRIVSFMEQHPDGFASLSEAAEAIADYLPHRARPRATHRAAPQPSLPRRTLEVALGPRDPDRGSRRDPGSDPTHRAPHASRHTAAPTLPARPRRRQRRAQRRHRTTSSSSWRQMPPWRKSQAPVTWSPATTTMPSPRQSAHGLTVGARSHSEFSLAELEDPGVVSRPRASLVPCAIWGSRQSSGAGASATCRSRTYC